MTGEGLMTVREVMEKLDLKVHAGASGLDREVTGGYAGDLLSDVMSNATSGDIWVTLQVHQNIAAVALLTKIAAVVLVGGRQPAPETVEKADSAGIPILSTTRRTFETVALLSGLGIGSGRCASLDMSPPDVDFELRMETSTGVEDGGSLAPHTRCR